MKRLLGVLLLAFAGLALAQNQAINQRPASGGKPIGSSITGTCSTANAVLYNAATPCSANLLFSDTSINSGPGLQVGTTGTSTGLKIGYQGSSGWGAIWVSTQASPSNSNFILASNGTLTTLAAGTTAALSAGGGDRLQATSTLVTATVPLKAVGFTNTTVMVSATAPTIASGGCTSPTVTNTNGTAHFTIDVGTSCSGSQPVVFTLPAATTGWNCYARNVTNPATSVPAQTGAVSTTSVTLTNYARTTGLAAAWTDGDDVVVSCLGG